MRFWRFLGLCIAVVVIDSTVILAQTQPADSVWYEPATARASDAITLNAFVYNTVQAPVSITVEFRTPEKVLIGSKDVALGVGSGATITQAWKMPAEPMSVLVTISKARNDKRVEVKGLEGTVGTIALDANAPIATTTFSFEKKISLWVKTTVSEIETWRLKEVSYYAHQEDFYRGRVAGASPELKTGTIGAYAGLVWTTVCSAIFSRALVFYIVGAVLIFLIIRFVIARIF